MASRRFPGLLAALAALWVAGAASLWSMQARAPFAATLALVLTGLLMGMIVWNVQRPRYLDAGRDSNNAHAELQSLHLLLDQLPMLVLGLGTDGRVRALNRAARTYFATEDQLPVPPPYLQAPLEPRDGALVSLNNEGAERNYRLSLVFVSGVPKMRALAVLTDVEAQIRSAQADTLRDLLRVLGHEVMNGLAPIRALAEALPALIVDKDEEAIRETALLIARKARAIDRFTQNYRTLAQIPPPRRRLVYRQSIADNLTRAFTGKWGSKIRLISNCEPGTVRAQTHKRLVVSGGP